jgi:hypothetical protein
VQVDAVVGALLSASGLPSVVADVQERASGTALAGRVMQTFLSADTGLFRAANGQLDLRTMVPGTLLLSGVATLLFKAFVQPQWYDLVFWSYVTFNNLHLVKREASSDAR